MEEFNVNTPEGLRRFLLAEAELDDELYAEEYLNKYLKENKLNNSDHTIVLKCLGSLEA